MTVASPPPPPPTGVPAPRKGMGPLGWIAIGCGAIALIGIIAFAVGGYLFKTKVVDPLAENPGMVAAELAIRANPDLELISSDREKGTMTIKNKQTGETVTVNASDIENGNITFETKEGKTVIDTSASEESGSVKMTGPEGAELTWGGEAPKDLPGWVPIYPGSDVQGAMDATNAEGRSATFSISTDATVDEVIEFYESKLGENSLQVTKNLVETNGERAGVLTGTSGDDKRTVTLMIGQSEGKTQATVSFQEKN